MRCRARLLPWPLLLAGVAAAQDAPLADRVIKALERARPALVQHLRLATRRTGEPGELALICLAALHDDVPTDDAVLARALRRLAAEPMPDTYALALRLMVLEAHAGFPDRKALGAADLGRLLRHAPSGAFSYGPYEGGDMSNTQYGALGLRAAASLGLEVPARTWRRLFDAAAEAQNDDGGFAYPTRPGAPSYPSMTAAGIGVLRICAMAQPDDPSLQGEATDRVAAAWRWMAEHRDAIGDPTTRSCYYFHYGLERAAILSEVAELDGHSWYAAGAEMLLRAQQPGGGWLSGVDGSRTGSIGMGRGNLVSTAFAVLFLRRRFQAIAVPITGPRPTVDRLEPDAPPGVVDAAVEQSAARGLPVVPTLLETLRSDVAVRRRAALRALIRIAGEDFDIHPFRTPEENAEALRRAERWWLSHRPDGG